MRNVIWIIVFTAVCGQSLLFAASPPPAWARHGMVASADAMATRVGVDVLQNGGNAVDAAAAVAFALGVTEGYASGIGGGCFILIYMADGRTAAIDGRETAPLKSSRLMFVPADTTQPSTLATEGVLAAGTPGEAAALELAVRTYGKLPFANALNGAIALADTGFIVDMRYERAINGSVDLLRRFEGSRTIFFRDDGTPLRFGDRLIQTDLAATLQRIQAEGIAAFYKGGIPQTVERYVRANGGVLTAADFAAYRPVVREPLRGSYLGYDVLSMPPPSSGGVHVLQILNLLEPFNLAQLGAGSSEAIHLIAEAMQIAFADRAEFLGDPDFTSVPVTGLTSKVYAQERRQLINRLEHRFLETPGDPLPFNRELPAASDAKHTTHFCVVDSFGNAVSVTATINTPFGSGVIVPGTGFLLNNEMDDFVTWPGRPNYFGLVGKAANEVEPGKRPLSSMAPTLLVKDGKPFLVVGSMGGPRIITSVALTILNIVQFGMNAQEATDFPRFHQQWVPDRLAVEPDIPFDVLENLRGKNHYVQYGRRWSAVAAIVADSVRGGWWGASDSRVGGLAAGF